MTLVEATVRAAALNASTRPGVTYIARRIGRQWEVEQYGPGKHWAILDEGDRRPCS